MTGGPAGLASGASSAGPAAPDTRSAYAIAIDATRDAVVLRARAYKRLVITVALSTLAMAVFVGIWRSAWPLLMLLFMPCAVLVHAAIDARGVQRWRLSVVEHWVAGSIDLALFASTLRQVPALPPQTIAGMLELLPPWASAVAPSARRALSNALARSGQLAIEHLVIRASAIAIAAAGLALAATQRNLAWLGLSAATPLAWWLWLLTAQRRARRARAQLVAELGADGVPQGWLQAMAWQGLPAPVNAAWSAKGQAAQPDNKA